MEIASSDVTIRDADGEVLLFSWQDFVAHICEGSSCFVCGRSRGERKFNDEHIVPDWVLRDFGLHHKTITLPNGEPTVYGNYKIPCCALCNTELARRIEDEIIPLIRGGADAVQRYVAENGSLLVFTWLALIFIKLHLKDRRLRRHLDRRLGDDPISAGYIWENMHHLHAVARAFHINAEVMPEAVGSLHVFPIDARADDFDLLTFTDAQTLYLQLGRTGMIAVFDDSNAATMRVMWLLEKITGPLSSPQARDLAAHFAMANLDLVNRPRFWTFIEPDRDRVLIGGSHDPQPLFREYDQRLYGSLLVHAFPRLPTIADLEEQEAAARLAAGDMQFLLDGDGAFIADHARKSGLIGQSNDS